MNFVVLTLFKDMVESAMNTSIMGRAIEKGLISSEATQFVEEDEE